MHSHFLKLNLVVATVMAGAVACSGQESPAERGPDSQTGAGEDYSVPPSGGKSDSLADTPTFDGLSELLKTKGTLIFPPRARDWELPEEAVTITVETFDASKSLGLETRKRMQFFDDYAEVAREASNEQDLTVAMLDGLWDQHYTFAFGYDHPQVRKLFIDEHVAKAKRAEVSAHLPRGTRFVQYTLEDTSAELVAESLFVLQPTPLEGAKQQAIAVHYYYSEVY